MGIIASIAHVLSGPDHLAAVTPLVFDTQKQHWRIGFFWGIGHIIGMLLIGVLFYFFKDSLPLESISNYSEQFVGILLIGIGLWSFYRIKNHKKNHKHPHYHETKVHIHKHGHEHTGHHHEHLTNKNTNFITALSIGIVHGFAGIAHFVLLLPVLGFETKIASLQYIFGFALGIVFAMITYTSLLTKFTKNHLRSNKSLLYNFQFWSGLLAILIGIFWIFQNA